MKKLCEFNWTGLQSKDGAWARKLWWDPLSLAPPTTRPASSQRLLLPPANPWGFWVKKVADGFFSSHTGKNKLWIFPLHTSKLCQGLRGYWVLYAQTPAIFLGFFWRLPSVPKAELMALWLPWSHSGDFCSDESRCDDNHAHWKSLEACRAKLSSDLTMFSLSCS